MRHTSRSLPIALLRARETVMAPVRAVLAGAGVTEQQWRVLRMLGEERDMEPKQLAEQACLLLPSLTRIMQALEARELITRTRDATDGRKLRLSITAEGRSLLEAHMDACNRIFDRLEAEFGADRVDELLDLLEDLVAAGARS